MSKIKIISMSSNGLENSPQRYNELGIDVIRVHFSFKGKDYLEGFDLDPVDFYNQLEVLENPKKNLPKTSMPSQLEIAAHFDKAIEDGYDEAIVFTISSALSGMYNSISAVAKDYEGKLKIHVVDTKVASFAEAMHAIRGAEMANAGMSAEEIIKETEWAIKHQEFYGVDGKLDYLIYNGRLKGAKAFMGKMLSICPVLRFMETGELVAIESVRTQKKALARMCENIKANIGDRDPKDYILYHIHTGPSLLNLLKEIEKKYGIETNHEDVIMSPSSGCHNGPWLAGYGLYCLRRNDEEL